MNDPSTYRISNSEIRTADECRRKWMLQYHRRLTPITDPRTGARQLGTLVHSALEAYYTPGDQFGDPEVGRSKLVSITGEDLTASPEESEAILKQLAMATAMFDAYIDWTETTGADVGMEVLATEIALEAPAPVEGFTLIGKLDILVRTAEGRIASLDHKVKQSVYDGMAVLGLDSQILTYQTLARHMHPNEPDWAMDTSIINAIQKSAHKRVDPSKDKTVRFARFTTTHSPEVLDTFWQQLEGKLTRIAELRAALDSGANHHVVAPPVPTRDCSWKCPFVHVCASMNNPREDVDALLAGFTTYNPNERYGDAFTEEPA